MGTDTPRTADSDESGVSPASRADGVLYQLALDLGLDPDYELFANPVDFDAVIDALPRLERWRHWFITHYGLVDFRGDENINGSGSIGLKTSDVAVLGEGTAARGTEQTKLEVG